MILNRLAHTLFDLLLAQFIVFQRGAPHVDDRRLPAAGGQVVAATRLAVKSCRGCCPETWFTSDTGDLVRLSIKQRRIP